MVGPQHQRMLIGPTPVTMFKLSPLHPDHTVTSCKWFKYEFWQMDFGSYSQLPFKASSQTGSSSPPQLSRFSLTQEFKVEHPGSGNSLPDMFRLDGWTSNTCCIESTDWQQDPGGSPPTTTSSPSSSNHSLDLGPQRWGEGGWKKSAGVCHRGLYGLFELFLLLTHT